MYALDASLVDWIVTLRTPWLDTAMAAVTDLGRASFIWLVIGTVAAMYPRHRASVWRLLLVLGLTYLMVDGLIKPFIDRPRPFETMEAIRVITDRPSSGSFPSGHAASAFAAALAVSRIWPMARPLWWTLAALIAISRVYLGVHYPSDILAGAIVGLLCGYFALGGRHPATYD